MKTIYHAGRLAVRAVVLAAYLGAAVSFISFVSSALSPATPFPLHALLWPRSTPLHWVGLYYAHALIIWLAFPVLDFLGDRISEAAKSAADKERDRAASSALCFEHSDEYRGGNIAYYSRLSS